MVHVVVDYEVQNESILQNLAPDFAWCFIVYDCVKLKEWYYTFREEISLADGWWMIGDTEQVFPSAFECHHLFPENMHDTLSLLLNTLFCSFNVVTLCYKFKNIIYYVLFTFLNSSHSLDKSPLYCWIMKKHKNIYYFIISSNRGLLLIDKIKVVYI